MKKGVILFIVILVTILITTVCATANSNESIVENLVCKRIDTLDLYYKGEINKEDAIRLISEITTEYLKIEDLQNLSRYLQCDLEQIVEYKITKVNIGYCDENVICAAVSMDWKAEGLNGIDNFSHTYSVICKKEEKIYKLAQFF